LTPPEFILSRGTILVDSLWVYSVNPALVEVNEEDNVCKERGKEDWEQEWEQEGGREKIVHTSLLRSTSVCFLKLFGLHNIVVLCP